VISTEFPSDLPPLPLRPSDSHKGSVGRVVVVGGSPGLGGAVILAVRAALRSGAGLVTAAIPTSLSTSFDTACVEGMSLPLQEDRHGAMTLDALPALQSVLEKADAVVFGPGWGRTTATEALFPELLTLYTGPHVIDADGLWFLARDANLLQNGNAQRVLTPHDGEFTRLSQNSALNFDPQESLSRQFAAKVSGVLVRKGPGTRIFEGTRMATNPTGNPGLATAGSGDVLSGIIGALLALGETPWVAARRGVWLHGLAGDFARERLGEESMIASDIIEELPRAFQALPRGES